ncbi:hypothetical protein [Algoriphagus sp.]|uniref:hypothetical protein n=1 Tax=Algoriphagus sp. TaxID=1872435 RepID=UPI003F7101D8
MTSTSSVTVFRIISGGEEYAAQPHIPPLLLKQKASGTELVEVWAKYNLATRTIPDSQFAFR